MREDLIERLRAVSARTNDPLLLEAAAALEAARAEVERMAEALLDATTMLLLDYPVTAKRLRAALHPTTAQENDNDR